ncbi:MAG TPA: pentapeptide repeat-containing protein [Candidatus Obscuribacterales bacterium]
MKRRILATATLLSTINLGVPAIAENLEHTQQLLSTKQCQQCDLSSAGLVMTDLSGAQLSQADLRRANLSRANLSGANLRGANLSGASLYGVNLVGADLTGANLTNTDLRDSYLVNANLVGTSLSNAYLQGAIGIPSSAGTSEDFYKWALIEAQVGNYKGAIEHYNQVLSLNPKFAAAYLGRGVAHYRLGNETGATQDVKIASQLFSAEGNKVGSQASQNFLQGMELARQPTKTEGGGSNFLNFLGGIGSLLLRFLF